MTDNERLAIVETQKKELERRIDKLEGNQKWFIVSIGSLLLKVIADILGRSLL